MKKSLMEIGSYETDSVELEKINKLEHVFTGESYVRKIHMPAGQIIISKIHKTSHPYFIMSGDVSVLTESGVERLKAPYNSVTQPGTQRVLYTHEDTVWITVHVTKETDLEKIEENIIAKDFKFLEEKE